MKPLAEHGTTARAKGRPAAGIPGCPCTPCRRAENNYDKRRRFLNQTGRSLMVDTKPVADHIRGLFAADAGWIQLAAVSGCSTSTIHNLLTEKNPQCRRSTANKLLAIQPGDCIPEHRSTPALVSIRKARALVALGHKCRDIDTTCGIDHTVLTDLLNGSLTTVSLGLARRVDAGFRKLSTTPGTSARSRNRAAREGWAPPAAWDDIDDPEAQPDLGRDLNFHERAELRREEIIHFAWHGDTPEQILNRLGGEVSISTVRQIVAEWRTGQKRQRKQVAA
ncbi:hypothetical protein [Streptomyces sp. NPDC050534]|uniref:hypothetical protein n=1 Tax=Streptomyces sp. NPDC050534 TaxID=3365625 RepID=UPI0037A1C828